MKTKFFCVLLTLVLPMMILVPGCKKRSAVGDPIEEASDAQEAPVIRQPTYGMIIVIVFDMSGSFDDLIYKKGYPFAMAVVDRYFRNRIGSNDRLIISQISAPGMKSLLWDGKPSSLKRDFASADKFKEFLRKKSNPAGSRLYDGISESMEYLISYPGVAEGKTSTAVFVLSDLDDNCSDPAKGKMRLLKNLAEYSKVKGSIGFYWVEDRFVPPWRQHMKESGIKHYVVEADIAADVPLPNID